MYIVIHAATNKFSDVEVYDTFKELESILHPEHRAEFQKWSRLPSGDLILFDTSGNASAIVRFKDDCPNCRDY